MRTSREFISEKGIKRSIFLISIIFFIALVIAIAFLSADNESPKGSDDENYDAESSLSQAENSVQNSDDDKEKWNLILVNSKNPLPDDYDITLKYLDNGQAVDERCYSDLQNMMDDCRKAGNSPLICSSYRTYEKQEKLFNSHVERWLDQGYSEKEARLEAGKLVAVPGTSEHQLGLAVDIVDISYQLLDEQQESTSAQKWLMENCWKYGFILRYPKNKTDITQISYEPWHYRYVGKNAAKAITESGVCLEEYVGR